jgi:transposase
MELHWAFLAGAGTPKGRSRAPVEAEPRRVQCILWILRTGAPWADVPDGYPSYQTCHRRSPSTSRAPRLMKSDWCAPRSLSGLSQLLERLMGDNAYESDRLDRELARRSVELIAPHRRSQKQRTQDGRRLRPYRRRWKVERLFAWFQNSRRIVVRHERVAENFLGRRHLPAASLSCGVYEMASILTC